jgi:hypothetical protein
MPINPPKDYFALENVYNSVGAYVKSLTIDNYARTYYESRFNCLKKGMQIFRADSAEADAIVLEVADIKWTLQSLYAMLHISANASGPLFVSNNNPSGVSEIALGNSSAYKMSVCEFIDADCRLKFWNLHELISHQFLFVNSAKQPRYFNLLMRRNKLHWPKKFI